MLLKPNMVLSGKEASNRASAEEVARYTVECFRQTVPAAVPGIVFLSGGQSDDEATANLDAINRYAAKVRAPWTLSFSYGRGLQAAPQKAWSGKSANVAAAQRAFEHRAKLTSAAQLGQVHAGDGEGDRLRLAATAYACAASYTVGGAARPLCGIRDTSDTAMKPMTAALTNIRW